MSREFAAELGRALATYAHQPGHEIELRTLLTEHDFYRLYAATARRVPPSEFRARASYQHEWVRSGADNVRAVYCGCCGTRYLGAHRKERVCASDWPLGERRVRIAVARETPVAAPQQAHWHERHKQRCSLRFGAWRVDFTRGTGGPRDALQFELELELVEPAATALEQALALCRTLELFH